jgi:multidrug efflux pump subunit AcrA (membrane-fusion protein)
MPEAPAPITSAPAPLLPRLLPIAAVSALALAWAFSPGVPVLVHGGALLMEPDSRAGVYARSAGQIQRVAVEVGAPLRQGQLLATINRVDQAANPEAIRRQNQAIDLQQQAMRSQIDTLRTSNQPIGQQLAALESLRRDEVIPRYSPLWVGAQDLYLRNRSQIRALEGQIAQLEAGRAELQAQRVGQQVFTPRAGTLLSLLVAPGQAVAPGQRIAVVGAPAQAVSRHRTAITLFTEADASRLRPGARVQVEPQLQSRDRYGGTAQRYGALTGRIRSLSPISLDAEALTHVLGDNDLAASLAARSRQEAFGEGGDPLATLGNKVTAPVMLVLVDLEPAATPSGLRWSGGNGPDLELENGTPALARVELERRPLVSFVLPFLRWLGGTER